MKGVTITDIYGDELVVQCHSHTVFLDTEVGDESTELALDRPAVKQLRKALKRALKELS